MRLVPKKHFEWKEPKAFGQTLRQLEAASRRWWQRPLAVLILTGFLILPWCAACLDPNKRPRSFEQVLPVALAIAWLFVYPLGWLNRLLPSFVTVYENKIFGTTGISHRYLKFSEIARYALRDCGDYWVLAITLKSSRQVLIGVPQRIAAPALDSFFAARGLVREET
jgi:hypothetical protein